MPKTNADLAAAFETADLLELQQANPFRVRAYRNAARLVGELKLDLVAQLGQGKPLPKLPGIGTDLAGKIEEFARSGHLALLDRLQRQVPAGLPEMLQLPGLRRGDSVPCQSGPAPGSLGAHQGPFLADDPAPFASKRTAARFNLGDALTILVIHEERHFGQIDRIRAQAAFPP